MARGFLSRVASGDRRVDEVGSIIEHLRVLLNTRIGESPCAPEFGVVDLTDLWLSLPDGLGAVEGTIRRAIERYEPRLMEVRVRHFSVPESLCLHFQVTGRLRSDPSKALRLTTKVDEQKRFAIV